MKDTIENLYMVLLGVIISLILIFAGRLSASAAELPEVINPDTEVFEFVESDGIAPLTLSWGKVFTAGFNSTDQKGNDRSNTFTADVTYTGHINVFTPYYYEKANEKSTLGYENAVVDLVILSDEPFTVLRDNTYTYEAAKLPGHDNVYYWSRGGLRATLYYGSVNCTAFEPVGPNQIKLDDDFSYVQLLEYMYTNYSDLTKTITDDPLENVDDSTAYESYAFGLSDFSAYHNTKRRPDTGISWTGLVSYDESFSVDNFSNTVPFVKLTFGLALKSDPGKVVQIANYEKYIPVHYNGVEIDLDGQFSDDKYIYYIRATPFVWNNDNKSDRLLRGKSSTTYFDVNQKSTGTKDEDISPSGSVYLDSLKLVNVKGSWSDITGWNTITFSVNSYESLYVPDKDTSVVASILSDRNTQGDYSVSIIEKAFGNSTFSSKLRIPVKRLYSSELKAGRTWDYRVYLLPTFKKDNVMYVGVPCVLTFNASGELISVDDLPVNSSGNIVPEPGTTDPDNPVSDTDFDVSSLLKLTSQFFSILKGLFGTMGALPGMFQTVFSFIPEMYVQAIGFMIFLCILMRILGR